jgi:hypothetical protein
MRHRHFALVLLALGPIAGVPCARASSPDVSWDYAFSTDTTCLMNALASRDKLPKAGLLNRGLVKRWAADFRAWTNEAVAAGPRMKQAWEGLGASLLKEAIAAAGSPFLRRELTAALFLCLNQNSVGTPLSVNVSYYLAGPGAALMADPTWGKRLGEAGLQLPLRETAFAEMAFHEILHLYVMQVLKIRKSELLRCRYRSETDAVKTHLHVFALEKVAFQRLAEQMPSASAAILDVLRTSQKLLRVTGATGYLRAWEIINSPSAGPEPFIAELQASPSGNGLCEWCTASDFLSVEWLLRLIPGDASGC